MTNPLKLVRRNILNLTPYSTARDEYQGPLGIFLDANENPYPDHEPGAHGASSGNGVCGDHVASGGTGTVVGNAESASGTVMGGFNRYPDPAQKELKKILSKIKGVPASQIFVGNGSDEAIDLTFRVFCEPRVDNAIAIAPSYGMYSVAAAINDVEMRHVQLGNPACLENPEFSLDTEAIMAATDEHTKLLFLCSPNNPSGNLLPRAQIEELLARFPGIVVIDEAYIDFADGSGGVGCGGVGSGGAESGGAASCVVGCGEAESGEVESRGVGCGGAESGKVESRGGGCGEVGIGSPSFVGDLEKYPNLLVLQTLSKAWGMAGLRLGLAFGTREVIDIFSRVKYPYNISAAVQCIVTERLSASEKISRQIAEIKSERARVTAALEASPVISKVFKSDANFVLVRTVGEPRELYQQLINEGIIVRDRSRIRGCEGTLRITIGTPEENNKLIKMINKLSK